MEDYFCLTLKAGSWKGSETGPYHEAGQFCSMSTTDNDCAELSSAGSATNRGRAPLAIRSNEEHQGERQPNRSR
jgi:hypothetical protein